MSALMLGIRLLRSAAFLVLVTAAAARAEDGLAAPPAGTDPFRHVQALHDIATRNGGNRAAGTPGYEQSARYVEARLRDAGYRVRLEEFTFPYFEERSPPVLSLNPGGADAFVPPPEALRTLRNSGSADVTAPVQAVEIGPGEEPVSVSTSGCEREDFADFTPGRIALLRRGTCPFQVKVEHAEAAGAAGVIIMNQGTEGQTGAFTGRLAALARIPVVGVPTETGRRLAAAGQIADVATVRLKVEAETGARPTWNVLGERGDTGGPIIMVGAHLDSVPEGPGMNDNASGSAAILEAALRLARDPEAGAPIRFAFWGAEERGLLGSRHHVEALPEDERRRIGLYVNLDMVGSPNFARFVHATPENRTGLVAGTLQALTSYFEARNLPTEERSSNRRSSGSDDASFSAKGIPTIGIFTGADGTKNAAQAERFGGSAGEPFDPCYHKACDTPSNVNPQVLGHITDALSHVLREVSRGSLASEK